MIHKTVLKKNLHFNDTVNFIPTEFANVRL